MEILNTGDELGRQILEDARRKSGRVLEAADRECAAIRDGARTAAAAEAARIAADRDRQVAALEAEMAATLPLDHLRTRLAFIQRTVEDGVGRVLAALDAGALATLVEGRVRRAAAAFAGRTLVVRRAGLAESAVRELLARAAPSAAVDGISETTGPRGLRIESSDGRVRFRCTTDELAAELLEERREELAVAALGRAALEARP